MNYFNVAEQIFQWLSQFQVKEKNISFKKIKDGLIEFNFFHPIKGEITCRIKSPADRFFQHEGIGFVFRENGQGEGVLENYDFGGIFDPIDNQVVGTHYATTHFAWLGALIYQKDRKPDILERVKSAIQFHLRTSPDEYVFDDWNYHWDFQNLAFINTFLLLESELDEKEKNLWRSGLKSWRQNTRNPLTNWVAMRVNANLERFQLFHKISDLLRIYIGLFQINKAYHKNGCFDDELNFSRPVQYHLYALALLHRILVKKPGEKLRRKFIRGVEYFISFIDPDGCFNYAGRGQEQIFAYAAAVYVLEAAAQIDPANSERYKFFAEKIWHYLLQYKKNDHFPLVLNFRDDKEKFGWYDYHHLTVYNAFLGVWLALASDIAKETLSNKSNYGESRKKILFEKETDDFFFSNENYFFQISGGLPEYLSEAAVTPNHIWFKNVGWVFTCPGGPSRHLFGKKNASENVEKNLLSPFFIVKDEVITTAFGKSKIVVTSASSIKIKWKFPFCDFERMVSFQDNSIEFIDSYHFTLEIVVNEWRYFNFPVVLDKFGVKLKDDGFLLNHQKEHVGVQIIETNMPKTKLELLEEIKTAKGLAKVVALRQIDLRIKSGEKYFIQFLIENFNKC